MKETDLASHRSAHSAAVPTYLSKVRVLARVMSSDKEFDADILSLIGAASLHLAQIPSWK